MGRRGIRQVAGLVVAAAMLAACGGGATTAPTATTGGSTPAPNATPTPVNITPAPAGKSCVAGQKCIIRWFVGLGSGTNPQQIADQQKVVTDFNDATKHPERATDMITLSLEVVQNTTAYDILKTEMAAGNAPDIIGPVGVRGRNGFTGVFADLAPYVQKFANDPTYKVDLTGFDDSMVKFFQEGGQAGGANAQIGLPYAVYPSYVFYNKDAFDEQNLPYPPQKVGDKYQGKDWDWNTVADLASQLTVDKNGKTAKDAGFDAASIQQYGFEFQWTEFRRMVSTFGAGSFVGSDGKAAMPAQWKDALAWYYDAVWTKHFIPDEKTRQSEKLASGNPVSSGHLAMGYIFQWYLCCMTPGADKTGPVKHWDIAVAPSWKGTTTAPVNADTFTIVKASQKQEQAYKAMVMLEYHYPQLLVTYGGMPARLSERDAYFKSVNEGNKKMFPDNKPVTWTVAADMLKYPDNPNHESDMPNFLKVYDTYGKFWTKINSQAGLNLDTEEAQLIKDIQAAFDEVK